MMSSLQELLKLAQPPENPIFTGVNEDIHCIEEQIGSRLPPDYIEYVHNYGACWFYRYCSIFPFTITSTNSIWNIHQSNQEQLSNLFENEYSGYQYPVYPRKNGVLLCGCDIFGNFIAWLTDGEPENWTTIYFDYDCGTFDKFDMNLTTFLLKLVKNEINPDCFDNTRREIYGNKPGNKPIVSVTDVEP
ncbi:MAG: SMI1/KNR4 family protein [Planctomycetaceae bacterium]|nr:SMI1/KNR4 family protein [Planctomycetaceae bacterium]